MDTELINKELERANLIYNHLLLEVKDYQENIRKLKSEEPQDTEKISEVAVKGATYTADMLRVGAQITTLVWALHGKHEDQLPSRAYDVNLKGAKRAEESGS